MTDSDLPTCTMCGQRILEQEPSRRNLVGHRHDGDCPTADVIDAAVRWALAHTRRQPDCWAEVILAADDLVETRHLVGLPQRAVAAVQAWRTADAARNAKADWRRRGETDRAHGRAADAREALRRHALEWHARSARA